MARFCTMSIQHDRSRTNRLCTRITEHRIDWTRHRFNTGSIVHESVMQKRFGTGSIVHESVLHNRAAAESFLYNRFVHNRAGAKSFLHNRFVNNRAGVESVACLIDTVLGYSRARSVVLNRHRAKSCKIVFDIQMFFYIAKYWNSDQINVWRLCIVK